MEYLNFIVLLQIIFLFFTLFFKNNNFLHKLLAVIILVPAFSFCFNILDILGVLNSFFYGILFFLITPIAFLFAPLVFYYVNLMCGKKIPLRHPLFIITALVVAYNLFLLFEFLKLDSLLKDSYVKAIVNQELPQEIVITTTIFILLQQIYFTVAAYRVYVFKRKVSNIFSTRSSIKIGFTKRFILLIWILNASTIIAYIIASVHFVEFVIMPIVLSLIISSIVYYAFEHKAIFNEKTYEIFKKDIKLINQTSLVFQADTTEESSLKNVLHAKVIEDFLRESKSYVKLDYTILDLSKDLGFSSAIVSSVINKELHKNFSKLINDFRIEESKLILEEKFNQINIESIAELSGFKSRASFYRAFKNKEGITPSEYIKQFDV